MKNRIFQILLPTRLYRNTNIRRGYLSPPPHHSTARYRNINLLSIDYAFRPRLRIRLTPGGRSYPGKPWAFGDQDSHLVFRYSCLHGHLCTVHTRFPSRFNPYTTLSYHLCDRIVHRSAVSVPNFSPDHFRRRITRPVSYYALFKWWLPLSQHPGCLSNSTSFIPLSVY